MPSRQPPRLALWIVERAMPARDRDAVLGDLIEEFDRLAGIDPAAARRWCRRQARRSIAPGLRRRCRDVAARLKGPGGSPMRGFLRDVRFGLRLLRSQPVIAAAGMLSLSIGLGLNLLLFTIANAILLRPLPVAGADRLVMIQMQRDQRTAMDFSYPLYVHLRDVSADVFDTLVAYGPAAVTGRVDDRPAASLEGEYVSGNFFGDLAVPMAAGRGLTPADDRPEAPPVVVVSHAFWRRTFGDAAWGGQRLRINDAFFTIAGVAAPAFFGTEIGRTVDFWLPIGQMFAAEREDYRSRATVSWLALMGRMRPGVTRAAAEARLAPPAAAFFEPLGFPPQRLVLADGSQGDSDLPRNVRQPLRFLMGACLVVLLIACVNVANLQLARTAARRQELAVRAALGAARGRLVSLLLADAVLVTVPAGLAALGAAALGKGAAARLISRWGDPVTLTLPIDGRVVLAAFGLTCAAAAFVGGVTAWLSTRRAPSVSLAFGGRTSTGGALRMQRVLVVVQFALSMTLVAGAVLLVRTVHELRGVGLGFTRNLALVNIAPGQRGYTPETLGGFYARAFDAVKHVPGVEAVAFAHVMPLDFGGSRQTIEIAGYAPAEGEDMELNTLRVSPGYFKVLGIRLLAGREFGDTDTPDAPLRIIVNETMANRYWPNGQAVGRFVRLFTGRDASQTGPRPFNVEVIGVAADVRYRMVREQRRPTFYVSTLQRPVGFGVIHVRTVGSPEARLGDVERAVASVDPDVPVARAFTLSAQLDRNIADERMARSLALALGMAALLLAATGLYATMAFTVKQRTREIGVRLALGAKVYDVHALILRRGLALVMAGALFGLVGALLVGRAIRNQLYGISPADATSLAGAALLLAAAALVAAWLPAHRASRVDPLTALRDA